MRIQTVVTPPREISIRFATKGRTANLPIVGARVYERILGERAKANADEAQRQARARGIGYARPTSPRASL
eukprot:5458823-Pleurochrysis_carterae.AAC.2